MPPVPLKLSTQYVLLCDTCCDRSGTLKELIKTGGCTCDICGWSCMCSGDAGKQYVNRVPLSLIPPEGWDYLHRTNERNSRPLDWERLFAGE